MKLDWRFIAENLAAHLASVDDPAAIARIVEQAERDAAGLGAPAAFWSSVAAAYLDRMERVARPLNPLVLEALGRKDEGTP